MKLIRASRFATLVLIVTYAFSRLSLGPGMDTSQAWPQRQEWLVAHSLAWSLGGWLWMLTIFAWMLLMVALMHEYTPVHRVSTRLQSGLVLISAVLLLAGILVWSNVLPRMVTPETAGLADALALTFLGGGLFMAGGVTAWVGVDLSLLEKLPRRWLSPGVLAGLCVLPTPFLLPRTGLLHVGFLALLVWCAFLGSRTRLPSAFPEYNP